MLGVQRLLSACLIMRDEALNLRRCLSSLQGWIDEVCVIDTGSTDESVSIAREFGARVETRPWDDDFSAARNAAWDLATGQWVLIIDADESLCEGDGPRLRQLVETGDKEAYFVQLLSYIGEEHPGRLARNQVVRLVRNRPVYRYSGKIHEGIDLTASGGAIAFSDIRLYHYGYLQEATGRKKKRERNMAMLQREVAKDPDNPYHRFNLGTEYFNLGNFIVALEHYEEAARHTTPDHLHASLLAKRRILCLQALGKHFQAMQVAKQAQKDFPYFTDAVFLKACSLFQMGQLISALQVFRACVEMGEPGCAFHVTEEVGVGGVKALWWIGQIYERLNDHTQAIGTYREALASEPLFRPALERLVHILNKRHSGPELLRVLELPQMAPDGVIMLVELLREIGDYEALEALFATSPLSDRDLELQRFWQGQALIRRMQIEAGMELLQRLPEASPYAEASMLEQALAHWLQRDWLAARVVLRRIKQYFGSSPGWQCYRAVDQVLGGRPPADLTLPDTDEARAVLIDLFRAFLRRQPPDMELVFCVQGLALAHMGAKMGITLAGEYVRLGLTVQECQDTAGLAPAIDQLFSWVEEKQVVESGDLTHHDWMCLARLAWLRGRLGKALCYYRSAFQADTCWAAAYLEPAAVLTEKARGILESAYASWWPGAEPLEKALAALSGDRKRTFYV